jgi:hypothetical protein
MPELVWKSLLESLTDAGIESPYLDRVRSRVDVAQGRLRLEREILQEIAQALGRAEDEVNLALAQFQLMDAQIERECDDRKRTALIESFNRQRDLARHALLDLVIHREALGSYRNEQLAAIYPIPPRKQW